MKLSPPVLGLGGRLRSGKDEAAKYLASQHAFAVIGMSDALAEALLILDPIVQVFQGRVIRYSEILAASDYTEAKKNPEVRRLLQVLGTEVGRKMIGENVWVQIIANKIQDHLEAGTPVVVTGIRFKNELSMIHQFAGHALWVERETEAPSADTASHDSENSVDSADFDDLIDNTGTIPDLHRTLDELMKGFIQ